MTINSIKAGHNSLIMIPIDSIGEDTKIETEPFNAMIIIYSDNDNIIELVNTVCEQRRQDRRLQAELDKEVRRYM